MNKLRNIAKMIKWKENFNYVGNSKEDVEKLLKLLNPNLSSEDIGKVYNNRGAFKVKVRVELVDSKYNGLYAEISYKHGIVKVDETLIDGVFKQNFTYHPKWYRAIYNYMKRLYKYYIKKEEIITNAKFEYKINKENEGEC